MSRQTQADRTSKVQSLFSKLAETIGRIDAEDLSGLAQVHGWCEALVEIGLTDRAAVSEEVAHRISTLARQLEALILGEVANANETFAELRAAMQQLAAECATALGGSADSTKSATSLTTDQSGRTDDAIVIPMEDFSDESNAPGENGVTAGAAAAEADTGSLEPAGETPSTESAPATREAYVAEPLKLDPKEIEFVKGFVEEAHEHVEAIEAAVLEVERCPGDVAKIDDLFRPFHTIKGMAGFLNLRDINCLTHEVETLLDQGRKGKRAVTSGVIDLVLSVVDLLKLQIASVAEWLTEPHKGVIAQPPVAEMIDRLRAVVAGRLDPDALSTARTANAPGGAPTPAAPPATQAQAKPEANATPQTPAPAAKTAGPSAAPSATQPATPSASPKPGDQSIRIDTEKLDALIDMVGELVIAQTLVSMSGDIVSNPKLSRDVTQVTKIVRDVQELAMAMRMVPIGPTFQKMARLVRDVSRKAGKFVNLTISGEDTELDKTVIQEIGDPLVHMVRNAIDHGIESPEDRIKAGKPETGEVHLHAGHEGGNILISIRDNGKGLDPAVLIAKAVEKGIISPTDELTEQEAYSLIFAPGFSTATQVTDISGRGVGMDVVKRNIDQLRGRIEIVSEKGKGTTFNIRLPLTLAIIDGMVIRVGRERFILPTITIQQSLRPLPEAITTVQHRGEVLNLRGELIPLIQLGELFGLTDRINPCENMVIIAHCEGRLIGLVVEELIGQQQVVIKSLGERFEKLQGISGAAILGDGRVGLILETSGLSAAHDKNQSTGRKNRGRGTPARGSSRTHGPDPGRNDRPDRQASDSQPPVEVACK
ncbi:MAG TPA: chemotaxis protein CheA [Phycisphaerae bacterium]|nr:chemotaxis protein CheA [Phycisphaerae bacterium]